MTLSEKQEQAYQRFLDGDNIFISGPGGTGKSYFIKKVYDYSKIMNKTIQVTSLTGCSAVLLNCCAVTIHKWCSLGINYDDPEKVVTRVRKYKQQRKFIDTEVLIIDEISMLNSKTFETIDYICKRFRRSEKPFGGIQVICCGDFYQLPPVGKTDEEKKFCFESPLWNDTFDHHIIFDENFRQSEDLEYFDILQQIRTGNISHEGYEKLLSCCKKSIDELEIKPTNLFPTKRQADEVNYRELQKLSKDEPEFTYKYKFHNDTNATLNKTLNTELTNQLKNSMCDEELVLKRGAQVMCISNIDQERNIVNGSQGIIIGFQTSTDGTFQKFPVVKFDRLVAPEVIKPHTWLNERNEKIGITQIPLILSWAITIHKSQGLSLEKAMINIGSNIFEYGQTYVALSRVKSLGGLYLQNINIHKIRANPKVKVFYESVKKINKSPKNVTDNERAAEEVTPEKKVVKKVKKKSVDKGQKKMDSFLVNDISSSKPSSSS